MTTKRLLTLPLVLILILCLCVPASAHSGKTDANGGHYDQSTGEYHYHHGYPAHSHIGGCPYDYDDKTDHSFGGSTSSGSSGSNGFLGLDFGTFFGCLLIFAVLFSFLTFKIGIGYMFVSTDQHDSCLPAIINIVAALVLAFIALIIIRTIIV